MRRSTGERRTTKVEMKEIVSRNPRVLGGDLVFAGTRVPVKNLVDYLAAGDTLEEFLDDFPGVSREQALAFLHITLVAIDALREANATVGRAPEDIPEREWLQAAAANPAFDFLDDPREDIYGPEDGRPFGDG